MLASLGGLAGETHEVDALWKRAETFASGGGQLTLARATVAPGALALAVEPARVHHDRGGLLVTDPDRSSPGALLGLRRGDLVTAVNGYGLGRPGDALRAYEQVASARTAVVELVRGGRRVALRIQWAS